MPNLCVPKSYLSLVCACYRVGLHLSPARNQTRAMAAGINPKGIPAVPEPSFSLGDVASVGGKSEDPRGSFVLFRELLLPSLPPPFRDTCFRLLKWSTTGAVTWFWSGPRSAVRLNVVCLHPQDHKHPTSPMTQHFAKRPRSEYTNSFLILHPYSEVQPGYHQVYLKW